MDISICHVIGSFRAHLVAQNYKPKTVDSYNARIRAFLAFAARKRQYSYSESLGTSFLRDVYSVEDFNPTPRSPSRDNAVLFVHKLNSIAAGVDIPARYCAGYFKKCPDVFEPFVAQFKEDYFMHSNSVHAWDRFLRLCRDLFDVASRMGVKSCNEITQEVVDAYFIGKRNRTRLSNATDSFRMRRVFRFMHRAGFSEKDLSVLCPRVIVYQRSTVPSFWSEEDLDKLLGAFRTGSEIEMRDFAIVMLALQCGLRSADIANLKLENLHWSDDPKSCYVEFRQRKTGVQLSNPMPRATACAIVNYLRNCRPESHLRNVFLQHRPPYGAMKVIGSVIHKYVDRCGLKAKDRHRGLHSLRHTFASRLIRRNVPLKVVSESLGHSSMIPTGTYISIDFDGLRTCALDPEEV